LLSLAAAVYGGGKTEEAAAEPIGKEWVLCVTAFDVSALPPSRRIIGEVLAVNLAAYLNDIRSRIRVSPEYAYYESTAHLKARQEAGKRLADKRKQRDELLFKGSAEWRYQKDLKAIDDEIAALKEQYAEADAKIPLVEKKPAFRLTQENTQGVFPAAPKPGGEYNYCATQKIDGLLTGRISEYHGRIYMVVRVYAIYARGVIYEDSLLFSSDDINAVIPEAGGRLVTALEGSPRATIAVTANPEDALISFDGAFAGRGRVEAASRAPGPVEIQVSAPEHAAASLTAELSAEEFAELQINLTPLGSTLVLVDVPDRPDTAVYRGALFIGRTPLELNLTANQGEHIKVETPEGETGSVIIPSGKRPESAALYPKVAIPLEEGYLDKSRRSFYGAFGRFWIVLPVWWIFRGVASSVISNYNQYPTEDRYNEATNYYWGERVLFFGMLGFATESVVRAFIYLYTSTKGNTKTADLYRK
jgi:hypothetical protein